MKLSQYMRLFGLTENELARKAGVSQPVINRMLNGRGNWTMKLMHKVAEATDGDVTMADLALQYVPEPKPLRACNRKPLAKVLARTKAVEVKRRRGRPTKEEAEARAKAAKEAVKVAPKKARAKG